MAAIIIESMSSENLKLLAELAEKLGDKVNKISSSQLEDLALGQMMNMARTGEDASRDGVFDKLRNL